MSNETSAKLKPSRQRRGPAGGMHGGGMGPAEKAKDFKGSFHKLFVYIGR